VSKALSVSKINQLFDLPISQEAFEQLLLLAQDLETLQGDNQDYIWSYLWGSPQFFPTKAYQHLIGHRQVHPTFSSFQQRLISTSLDIGKFIQLSPGSGKLLLRRSIKFSSGSC
jgi:hypothetical protein